ncbi:hypothetical protein [Desulfosporosinus sp. FKB]|uniref:hypothetical protein n=1 Tax=Desulfosporosinus sp. FKB TaxID=1969835 RepID=UPI000B4A171D|nr:hypothetical protein [Desulfosporosinus sp. FKB]
MKAINEKIMKALEDDKELMLKIQNVVRLAVEKELVDANIIESGELHNTVGCVSVLFTITCTC